MKPKPPITLWIFAIVIVCGLLAMFQAAYHAFVLIMPVTQAILAAILIEAAMVADAIAAARGKNWLALASLVIGITISGTYNYIQAQAAGAELNSILLSSLAIGPLAALTSISMAAGKELAMYEKRVTDWKLSEQARQDKLAERQQARADKMEVKRMEQERQIAELTRQENGNLRQVADENRQDKIDDWRKLTTAQKDAIAKMTTDQIMAEYPISERAARYWKERAAANGYHKEVQA